MKLEATRIKTKPTNQQARHILLLSLLNHQRARNQVLTWENIQSVFMAYKKNPWTGAINTKLNEYKEILNGTIGLSIQYHSSQLGYGIQCTTQFARVGDIVCWVENCTLDNYSVIELENGKLVTLSGIGYFFNHSCKPNCELVDAGVCSKTKRNMYQFRLKQGYKLKPGEWATIHYGPEYFKEGLYCCCGESCCTLKDKSRQTKNSNK
jgi:hypothetical protein